jgi:hypothetical protein
MILLLMACNNEANLESTEVVDRWTQDPASAVDILLVVDDSCSMHNYQEKLGGQFDAFVQYFGRANVDYRIGVTTTDATVESPGTLVGPAISVDTPNPDAAFASQVAVGTAGSSLEMGLETAWQAAQNQDFVRDGSSLSVLVVSDEEDSSPRPVNDYLNDFFALEGGRSARTFNFSAITVTNQAECTSEQAAASRPGDRYVDAAWQTHGVVGNLCAGTEEMADTLGDFSLIASRLQRQFLLSSRPDTSSLEVTVQEEGGEPEIIPCDAAAWTYRLVAGPDGATPAVVFDAATIPPIGSSIIVRYTRGDGSVAAFCNG